MRTNQTIRRAIPFHFLFLAAASAGVLLPSFRQVQPIGGQPPVAGPYPAGLEAPPEPPPAQPAPGSCGGSPADVPNVYLHSGEVTVSSVDLRIPGRGLDFVWARKYRSRNGPNTAQGNGWDFSYNARIEAEGSDVRLFDGNTRSDLLQLRPGNVYAAEQFFREGKFEVDGSFTLTFADGGTWSFRALDGSAAAGRLQSSADRHGNALMFAYDGAGRLTTITDTLNRTVTVAYDGNGRIASVTDSTGRSVVYAYYQNGDAGGSAGDLKSARTPIVVGTPNGNDFPTGKTTVYTYSKGFADERLNHNLLTVTDPKGQTWLAHTYSSALNPALLDFDRVVRQQRGGAADTIELVYVSLRLGPVGSSSNERLRVIANDRVGNVREYFYDRRGRLVRKLEFTGRANPAVATTSTANRPTAKLRADDPDSFETRWEYNEDSLATAVHFPNGNVVQRVYELALDPGADWRSRGNLREVHRLPGTHVPAGDQAEIVELFEYETGMGGCCGTNFVKSHTDPRGNVTVHTYDSFGNRTHTQHPVPAAVEDYEYDSFGRMTAHVLPPNGLLGGGTRRRDEMRWYGPGDGAQNGYLKETVADAPNFALTTRYEYDARGNLVRKVDPRGNDTLFDVNALNQVVRERSRTVPGGARVAKLTAYDQNDNVVRQDVENRDESGVLQANIHFTTTWDHGLLDERVRETREVDPSTNSVTEYGYDANRNRTFVRFGEAVNGNQPANTETTLYDERDLVYRVIRAQGDALQSTTQKDWDGNRNPKAVREGLESGEHLTQHTYDGYDRLVRTVDPMGNETERHYDAAGSPSSEIVRGQLVDVAGPGGNVRLSEVSYQYDAMNRRIAERTVHFDTASQALIGDGEATATTDWSAASQVVRTIDDHGHFALTAYDTANRRSVARDPRGNTATHAYDANGNVVSLVEVDESDLGNPDVSRTTTYVYDNLDRRRQRTDNSGQSKFWAYDSRGNVVRETDPRSNDVQHAYDGLDRLVQSERIMTDTGDGFGIPIAMITTTQGWDASSRLVLQSDGNGNPTTYAYDALDRRVSTSFADGTEERVMQRDAHGNEIQRRDPNFSVVTSAFDGLDRAISRTVVLGPGVSNDTTSETYQYDGLSRLVRAQDNDSLVLRDHDSLGNITRGRSQVLPGGPLLAVTSGFDGIGNTELLVYPGGRTIQQSFDALERLRETWDLGTGLLIARNWYVGPLDPARTSTSSLAEFIVFNTAPGRVNLPQPDASGLLERIDFGNDTRLDVQRDAVRRVAMTSHVRVPGGALIDQRSTNWDPSSNKSFVFEFFSGIQRTYEYDSIDRLVRSTTMPPLSSVEYSYDAAGNRTSVVGGSGSGPYSCNAFDCAVNQYTTTPMDSRAYDSNGDLTQKPSSGAVYTYDFRNRLVRAVGGGLPLTTYRYDCLGRRIERTVSGVVSRFYYCGEREIEEQDAGGATVATWVWGANGILQMKRGVPTYFYHGDDLGSPVAVTDSTGNCVERYAYADFGRPSFFNAGGVHIPNTAVHTCFYFHSMRAETIGWYLAGDRFYDQDAGRFVQRDSVGMWADGNSLGNPFTFMDNNPLSTDGPPVVDDPRAAVTNVDLTGVAQGRTCAGPCTGRGPVHWSRWINTNSWDLTKRAAQDEACKAAAGARAGDENQARAASNEECRKRGGFADCTCRNGNFSTALIAPETEARSSKWRRGGMGFSTDFSTDPPTSHHVIRYGCAVQYDGTCGTYKDD